MLHTTRVLITILVALASGTAFATQAPPSQIDASAVQIEAPHPEAVILDYHSFLGSKNSSIDYSDDDLSIQLDRIKAIGYTFVTLEDAVAGRMTGKANVVITIDDGNHSVYQAFEGVFKSRGILPTLFIYPAIVDKSDKALSSAQLLELSAAGCGIGAHGFYHEYMTPRAYLRDPKKVMVEVERPGPALEKKLGKRPVLFAYPFGVGSPEVEAALAKEGYSWAFLADDKVASVDFRSPGLDHFAVPRTIVYHWNKEAVLKALAARLTK